MRQMLKNRKGKLGIVVILVLALGFLAYGFSNAKKVKAADSYEKQTTNRQNCPMCVQRDESKCETTKEKAKLCNNEDVVKAKYDVKYGMENKKVTVTAKEGTFDVIINGTQPVSKSSDKLVAGEELVIQYAEDQSLDGVIALKLNKADDVCEAGCYIENIILTEGAIPKTETNEDAGSQVCVDFNNYVSQQTAADQEILKTTSAYTHCNSTEVSTSIGTFDDDFIQEMVDTAKSYLSATKRAGKVISDNDSTWKKINPPAGDTYTANEISRYIGTETCEAFKVDKNTKKYYSIKEYTPEDAGGVCSVKCKEEFEVEYDAPVASKGGLCFTYSVKVKSRTTCTTVVKKQPPKLEDFPMCNPLPTCGGHDPKYGGWWKNQAGPNDKFDSCVSSCDGGKYTQKCINKCYKKVYGKTKKTKTTKTTALNNTNGTVLKIADNSICPRSNWESIKKYKAKYPGGEYQYDNNKKRIVWVQKEGKETYTIGDKTYEVDYGSNCWNKKYGAITGYKKGGSLLNKGLPGAIYFYKNYDQNYIQRILSKYDGAGPYYFSREGDRRAYNCGQVCTFSTKYCSKGSKDTLNKHDQMKKYRIAMNDYNAKLAACNDAVQCKSESSDKAVFTMRVDLPAKNGGTGTADNTRYWEDKRQDNNHTIIRQLNGKCYGGTDTSWDYVTKINFPGTWQHEKHLNMVYTNPNNIKYAQYGEDNEFCLPLDVDNVNSRWWIWKTWDTKKRSTEGKIYNVPASVANTLKQTTNNIRATVRHFGYFGWGININCFYATYNGTPEDCKVSGNDVVSCPKPETPDTPDPDDGGDKTTTDPTNIDIRNVDNSNIFPNSTFDTSKLASETKNPNIMTLDYSSKEDGILKLAGTREIGYNWSCEATNVNNPEYPIVPVSLIEHIQSTGDKFYDKDSSEHDSELDYHFTLNQADLKNIRNWKKSKEYGTYVKEDGTEKEMDYHSTTKIYYYQSSLINKYFNSSRSTSILGRNNNSKNAIPIDDSKYCYKLLTERQATAKNNKGLLGGKVQ